jgi:hypothetical protein
MSNETIKKISSLWIRNTQGEPSISATFATVAFAVTTLAYVAAIFEKIGPLSIRPFDPTVCAAYLMPILGLYASRKLTDANFPDSKAPSDTATPPKG